MTTTNKVSMGGFLEKFVGFKEKYFEFQVLCHKNMLIKNIKKKVLEPDSNNHSVPDNAGLEKTGLARKILADNGNII